MSTLQQYPEIVDEVLDLLYKTAEVQGAGDIRKVVRREFKEMLMTGDCVDPDFLGIVFSKVTPEEGPIVSFNDTNLVSESEILGLTAQGVTLSGMGEYYHCGLYGPVPVPNSADNESLIYTFMMDAPNSSDIRIRTHGMASCLFLLFRKGPGITHLLSVRPYFWEFLDTWIQKFGVEHEQLAFLSKLVSLISAYRLRIMDKLKTRAVRIEMENKILRLGLASTRGR